MQRRSRTLRVAGYIAIAAFALLLWPQRWGGTMTYDLTHGTSMEPTFHTGDLAVLRKASRYGVGDVAAYRSPSLHTTVMHRIKTETAIGYTFQGDNNKFVDPDTVTDKQLVGKLVFRVPRVGIGIAWLLRPLNLVLALGGLYLLFSERKDKVVTVPPAASTTATAGTPNPLVVRITALRLPQELPTADLEFAEDLQKLARLHGIAILRDATTDYLMQGGMLFRHVHAETANASLGRRRSSPQGRDWVYDQRPDADIYELANRRISLS